MTTETSITLLQQRLRNRLIDYFDTSFEEIAQWGTDEYINMWEDIMTDGWDEEFFSKPVFSHAEQMRLKRFCLIWDLTAKSTKQVIFKVKELQSHPEWIKFIYEANSAFDNFNERGMFSNDVEQF